MADFIRKNVRLSLFFFFLLFLSGRIGLLLHEFAGHALSLRLLGGRLTGFNLFVFGGGRIHYGWTPATENLSVLSTLFVQLSGIVVELIAGCLLALVAIFSKTTRATKALFSAASSVLIVHGLFYLVICSYYGSGDGGVLFAILHGNVRYGFLFLTFGLTVGGAFLVSFAFSPVVRSWVVDCPSKKQVLLIALSAVFAALLHGVLTVGEQVVVRDRAYAEIKTPESVRLKERELSEFVAEYTEKHGKGPGQEELAVVADELDRKYWQFPIEVPLVVAVLVAFMAGFLLSGRRDSDEPSPVGWKDNGVLGLASALSAALVVVLNRM